MQSHEERVVQERDDLLKKIRKLGEFLETQTYSNLAYEDRKLLNIQHTTMQQCMYIGMHGSHIPI